MTQFTQFAALQVVETNEDYAVEQGSEKVNLFNDASWERETMLANESMNTDQLFMAVQHYTAALKIAKNLFIQYKDQKNPPETIVPIIVVSGLNLAGFWAEQGRDDNEKKCLVEAFDHLVDLLDQPEASIVLQNQICHGIGKIYSELALCLREMGDFKTLEIKKDVLMSL